MQFKSSMCTVEITGEIISKIQQTLSSGFRTPATPVPMLYLLLVYSVSSRA